MLNVVKLYPSSTILPNASPPSSTGDTIAKAVVATSFRSYGRIFSGKIYRGKRVSVLGNNFYPSQSSSSSYSSIYDNRMEDMDVCTISHIYISVGRYNIEVDEASVGISLLYYLSTFYN
jgi:translation elongation factor EF-G